jgi:hypothetical protein
MISPMFFEHLCIFEWFLTFALSMPKSVLGKDRVFSIYISKLYQLLGTIINYGKREYNA